MQPKQHETTGSSDLAGWIPKFASDRRTGRWDCYDIVRRLGLRLNVTVPVGVPEACAVTVAVNVMEPPKTLGFCDKLSVAVVAP